VRPGVQTELVVADLGLGCVLDAEGPRPLEDQPSPQRPVRDQQRPDGPVDRELLHLPVPVQPLPLPGRHLRKLLPVLVGSLERRDGDGQDEPNRCQGPSGSLVPKSRSARHLLRESTEADFDPEVAIVPIWDYHRVVRVIALSTLKAFWDANPSCLDAKEPVLAWYRQTVNADWRHRPR
jgi:hypothetical protein